MEDEIPIGHRAVKMPGNRLARRQSEQTHLHIGANRDRLDRFDRVPVPRTIVGLPRPPNLKPSIYSSKGHDTVVAYAWAGDDDGRLGTCYAMGEGAPYGLGWGVTVPPSGLLLAASGTTSPDRGRGDDPRHEGAAARWGCSLRRTRCEGRSSGWRRRYLRRSSRNTGPLSPSL